MERQKDKDAEKVHRKKGRVTENGENSSLRNKPGIEDSKEKPTPERSLHRATQQMVRGIESPGRQEPRVRKEVDHKDPVVTGEDQQETRVRRKRREQNPPDAVSPKGGHRVKRDLDATEKVETAEPVHSSQERKEISQEQTPRDEKKKQRRNKPEVPSAVAGQSLEKNTSEDKVPQHKVDDHTQERRVKAEQSKSKDGLDNIPSKEAEGDVPADTPRRVRRHRSRNDNEQTTESNRQNEGEKASVGAEASVPRRQKNVSNEVAAEGASKTPEGARQRRTRRSDRKGEYVQDTTKNIDATPRKSDSAPNESNEVVKDSKQSKTESTSDSVHKGEDSTEKVSPEAKVTQEDKTDGTRSEGNSVQKEPSHQVGDNDKPLDKKSPPKNSSSSKERKKIHRRTVSQNAHILDDDQPERSIHRRTASQNSSVNDKRGGRKHQKKTPAGEPKASVTRTEPGTETSADPSLKALTPPQTATAELQAPTEGMDPCGESGSKAQTETSATVKTPGPESEKQTENNRDESLNQFDTIESPRIQAEKAMGIPPMHDIRGNSWNDSCSESKTEELPQSLSSGNMEFQSLLSQNNSSDPSQVASQDNQTQDNALSTIDSKNSLNGQSKELDSLFRSGESLNDSRSFVDPGPPIPSADAAPFHLYPENDEAHFSPLVTATDSTLDIDSSLFPTEPNFPAPLESEMDSLHFPTYKMSGQSNHLDTDEQSDSLCIGPSVKPETDNSDSESVFFKKQHSGEWLSSSSNGSGAPEDHPDGNKSQAKEDASED